MKNKPTDMTWNCGCRMYEDGLNMVWSKCGLHLHAVELLTALVDLMGALTDRMLRTGANRAEEAAFKAARVAISNAGKRP